jgi:hypothetical protein
MENRIVERRTILLHLAGGLAGTVVGANTTAEGAAADRESSEAREQSPTAAAPPRALDEYQRQMLDSLADMLVPGARAAGVADLLARVLAVESPSRRREFMNALGAFEREARDSHQKRWIDLDEAQRVAILQRAADGPESRPLPPPWHKGQPVVIPPAGGAPPATLRDHFTRLRASVANAYFATEPGMRELGWRGRTGWTELPGCEHPESAHE